MFGKKAARIAELEARLVVALRQREPAADTARDAVLRSELTDARKAVAAKDTRIGLLQRQVDQLIARLGEYADAGIANGQRADTAEAKLTTASNIASRLGAQAIAFQDVLDDMDRGPWANTIRASVDDLQAALGEPQPVAAGPRCICGAPLARWTGPRDPGWIHSPGSDTRCLDARPAADPCAHGCRDAADQHTQLSQELAAGEVRP
jgi:hypothetical protein